MPNLRWLKLNQTGLEALPDELSHLMKLVNNIELLFNWPEFRYIYLRSGLFFYQLDTLYKRIRCEHRCLQNMQFPGNCKEFCHV